MLHDPYLLKDMNFAVERILQAKEHNERVMIFWDYDADGITGTAILMHFFKKIWMQASYRIPSRIQDGYGLKTYFIDEWKKLNVKLIITVDCGSKDEEIIAYAKANGIECIITDHHALWESIPKSAVAFINPQRVDCPYPFKYLSGAGIAFKLVCALCQQILSKEEQEAYIQKTIDIVAIGTVGDCMPIIWENRFIVKEWLKQIPYSRSKWIQTLIKQYGISRDTDILSFYIVPKLNVAGRLGNPYTAINLLLNNSDSVYQTIKEIEILDEKRKILTQYHTQKALETIDVNDPILFYVSPDIEQGIIGIVAGKLAETLYRPAIVAKHMGDTIIGSCRSPEYFSIIELLNEYKELFLHYGGHQQAWGFTISQTNFDIFKNACIWKNFRNTWILEKTLTIDQIISEKENFFNIFQTIKQFTPYGTGNPRPIFFSQNIPLHSLFFIGKWKNHIKLSTPFPFETIGFWLGEHSEMLLSQKYVSLVFEFIEDTFSPSGMKAKVLDIVV